MKRELKLVHEFVEFVPTDLKEGTLYVSVGYATVVHRCCCGCGKEVVTPLSPTDWRLTYDGETVTLNPSIGNWDFPCQSHYWIERNEVVWAPSWSREEIAAERARDRQAKTEYFNSRKSLTETSAHQAADSQPKMSLWNKLKRLWS